ncbi:MAG TPA: DsbA family protein [bacterium]|nr:DsbA family protein [bacterium]HPT29741.1 DsbA family protein [bacterium]
MPRHRWYKSWWGIFLILTAILVVSFVLAFAFYIKSLANKMNSERASQLLSAQQAANQRLLDGLNPYYLGTSTPQITIVEFGDFACSRCRESFTAIHDLAALHPDTVKIIWRDFLGHDDSFGLALAARCAGEQGKFWEMHDGLFLHQGTLNEERILDLAKQFELNTTQFSQCIKDNKYARQIAKDKSDGELLKVVGTPTWFVNNSYRIETPLSLENLQKIIEELNK